PSHISVDGPSFIMRHAPSLHDALPIFLQQAMRYLNPAFLSLHADKLTDEVRPGYMAEVEALCQRRDEIDLAVRLGQLDRETAIRDRKSTRLNSSHVKISYAVFCSKNKR